MPRDNTTKRSVRTALGKAWNKIRETIGKPSGHDLNKEKRSNGGTRG